MLSTFGIETCCSLVPAKTPQIGISPKPQNPSICSYPNKKPLTIPSSSSAATQAIGNEEREKMKVVVKAMERPRLLLKFIWMEKNIGIAIDQLIPGGHGTIPVSPYYFWPRKDAWEELKLMIETKPWISQKQKVILLNQATDIINLWQQTGHS
ncbi:30S ribosomal protein 3, chloroplastic-like [Salvia miltiorrhiza]|uniref:30S ribosomal protein 3, chloroplastic-like n=1 Tax=Salvia miltiorrhiza TaxID=226208 RepID=UPI0025AD9627|nr:30S ribosomal protein 3, chloroplastic-like [Salvia miltiorrhiza]